MNVRAVLAALVATTVLGGSIAAAVPAPQAKKAAAPAKKGAARVIEITGDDTMKFNVTNLTAKPGERVTIRFINKGTMPKMAAGHNVVVLKPGVDMPAFAQAAVMAGATDYIPAKFKDQIVANTKIAGPGETVEVTFTVPTAPGDYPYICSFPGHYVTMKGTLKVA